MAGSNRIQANRQSGIIERNCVYEKGQAKKIRRINRHCRR
jgi:hypothetical protein